MDKLLAKLYCGNNPIFPSAPLLSQDKCGKHLCIHKDLKQEDLILLICTRLKFIILYYNMRNFCHLIGLEALRAVVFELNLKYLHGKLQNLCGW